MLSYAEQLLTMPAPWTGINTMTADKAEWMRPLQISEASAPGAFRRLHLAHEVTPWRHFPALFSAVPASCQFQVTRWLQTMFVIFQILLHIWVLMPRQHPHQVNNIQDLKIWSQVIQSMAAIGCLINKLDNQVQILSSGPSPLDANSS